MNRSPLIFFNYLVENSSNGTLDLYIDGDIVDAPTQELYREFWGDETSVSYKSMRDQVLAHKPSVLNIYINSGGGQVTEALAMHDFLKDLENKGTIVNRYGRGIIASAATYLLMGKNSSISKNSFFMIHNVSGGVRGDVNVIENAAKLMRQFNNQVRDLYVEYTGLSSATITDWMNKETWFNGTDAVAKKFVHNVTEAVEFTNSISPEHWTFSNTSVLKAYNSFVKNNHPDMKFDLKKLGDVVANAVKTALNIGKPEEAKPSEMTAENLQNTISTAVTNAIEAVLDTIQEAINKEVAEGVDKAVATALENAAKTDGAIAKAISNALTEALKENGVITNAVTEATKDLVTTEAFENLKKDLGGKIGNQSNPKDKKPKGTEVENKGEFDHEGISWGSDEDE